MEGAVLVWLLCLQGSLLANALNCADKGTSKLSEEYRRECVGGAATKTLGSQPAELTELKSLAPSGAVREPGLTQLTRRVRQNTEPKRRRNRPGTFTALLLAMDPEPTTKPPPPRQKRHLESERDRSKRAFYPGSTSVTGQPMRLMLTERSRRQLPAGRPKPKRKPRVGSFSLLSHKQPRSLQVTRVRRQLQNDKRKKKKKKPGNAGQYSILGESLPLEATRVRRHLQNEKKSRKSGLYSVLGLGGPTVKPPRSKRDLQPKRKKTKKIVCP